VRTIVIATALGVPHGRSMLHPARCRLGEPGLLDHLAELGLGRQSTDTVRMSLSNRVIRAAAVVALVLTRSAAAQGSG
jgi:hypothetical protein